MHLSSEQGSPAAPDLRDEPAADWQLYFERAAESAPLTPAEVDAFFAGRHGVERIAPAGEDPDGEVVYLYGDPDGEARFAFTYGASERSPHTPALELHVPYGEPLLVEQALRASQEVSDELRLLVIDPQGRGIALAPDADAWRESYRLAGERVQQLAVEMEAHFTARRKRLIRTALVLLAAGLLLGFLALHFGGP